MNDDAPGLVYPGYLFYEAVLLIFYFSNAFEPFTFLPELLKRNISKNRRMITRDKGLAYFF
jgi:hypothetical protein